MIGDMFNNNNRRNVCTREGQLMYMGKKYAQEKSGYYVCTSGKRRRLHDVMWEHETGLKIPEGCVVHHIDCNKTHNEISNLTCITVFGHNLIHNPSKNRSDYNIKIVPGGISEVIPV
jgi:hypothetical protein